MSRIGKINAPRRFTQTGNDVSDTNDWYTEQHMSMPSTSAAAVATSSRAPRALVGVSAHRNQSGGRHAAAEQSERETVHTVEEIAALLMQVAEKKERCRDFDLQYWLMRYDTIRTDANFPAAGMLVDCAAHIYGRKVDYLSDIVIHMNDDQKSREQKQSAEQRGEDAAAEASGSTGTGRKRANRFNPQSVSDCFGDIEFTVNDSKLLKMDDLINPPEVLEVDGRSKFEQMQELCRELRLNPTRQRRQQILNRLRDEASIASMVSSHGVARRNQILDLESSETIGTRYDYQIHHNYIDGRTGTLIAEHDLKRFFQRCDVMDYLAEQYETERDRCEREGIPAPADMLSVKGREVKIFMPPEYLKDQYRISVTDSTDFDHALVQARITNFNSDPILSLMDSEARERRCQELEREEAHLHDSGYGVDSSTADDHPSFNDVLCSSLLNDSNRNDMGEENPLDSELMALEASETQLQGKPDQDGSEKSTGGNASRLSVDEGIGVDCESPPRSASRTQEMGVSSDVFSAGTVILRPTVTRPVDRLLINLFRIPEKMTQRHSTFSLPVEYRKMKMDLVQRTGNRSEGSVRVNLYSLHPSAARNPLWVERPTTPDLEDFLGFDDDEAPDMCKGVTKKSNKASLTKATSAEGGQPTRPATPEPDFAGFTEEEIAIGRKSVPQSLQLVPKEVAKLASPIRSGKQQQNGDGTSSQPVTPSRTLSCDSGISDTIDRGKESPSCSETESPVSGERDDRGSNQQPLQEHTDASNARIQQQLEEAKERMEKVNAWHRKLKPILLESERRNHFDIHEHGTEIIDTFDRVSRPATDGGTDAAADGVQERPIVSLATVLQNKPPHSTARYFLSLLMLANTNNVEIVNANVDTTRLTTTEQIQLRLLSRKRHHQEMAALGELLPSESDPDRGQQKRQNRKRKLLLDAQTTLQTVHEEPMEVRPDPAERLSSATDDCNFMDSVQNVYGDRDSTESKRQRLAFRRGMRNCAYGLVGTGDDEQPNRTKDPPPPRIATPPKPAEQPAQPAPPPALLDDDDEIMQIDLSTHHAMFVGSRNRDPDDTCAKSMFSLAESGYESLVSEENFAR